MRAWLRARPLPESEFVFTSIRDGRRMTGSTVIQVLRRMGKRAGVSGRVDPHAFRHAFARELILNGGDIGTVSQILGHTQIGVTKQFCAMFTTDELKGEHDRFSPVSRLNGQARGVNRR
jgi:site-specific recombinase XerD